MSTDNTTITDELLETIAKRHNAARSYIQGFHYHPRHVIRDLRKPEDQQEIWSCPDSEAPVYFRRLEIEYMRFALEALNV